jgi:Mg2+ and Co2+ transporter CorA
VSLSAQTLNINRSTYEHDDKARPSVEVKVEVPPKYLKKAWEDYLKDEHNVHIRGIGFLANKDMLSAEKVVFEALSQKEMDFYTHFASDDGVTTFHVFGSLGYDIYIGGEDLQAEFKTMRSIVESFLDQTLPAYFAEKVEEAEEKVADLRDDISDAEKDLKNNKKEIEKLQEQIAELEKLLREKNTALSNAEKKLDKATAQQKEITNQLQASRRN